MLCIYSLIATCFGHRGNEFVQISIKATLAAYKVENTTSIYKYITTLKIKTLTRKTFTV
jgi:hypothetical protein